MQSVKFDFVENTSLQMTKNFPSLQDIFCEQRPFIIVVEFIIMKLPFETGLIIVFAKNVRK